MDKVKKISKCIIFLVIGFFIFNIVTYVIVPKETEDITMKTFYNESINTIDVIALGSSSVRSAYSPITIWKEYGITSYSLGTSSQTIGLSYYMLLEALKYQNPKVIILDLDNIFAEDNELPYRKTLNSLKLDNVKIKAIGDENLYNVSEDKLSYIFPLLRYHDRWNNLKEEDFYKLSHTKNYKKLIKGNAIFVETNSYIDNKQYMKNKKDSKKEKITNENICYLEKIIELCKTKNIQMLWTSIPDNSWSFNKSETIMKIANQYGIEFIDYNLEPIQKEIGFDWKTDTRDKGRHLNSNGADVISKHIGQVLQERYNCASNKHNKTIAGKWEKEVIRYDDTIKKLEQEQKNKQKK